MNLSHGGHLTHGHPLNFSGRFYNVVAYGVRKEDERIDYEAMAALAREHRPKIVVVGASAYPRTIDFAAVQQGGGRVRGRDHGRHRPHRGARGYRPPPEPGRRTASSSPPPRTRPCADPAGG